MTRIIAIVRHVQHCLIIGDHIAPHERWAHSGFVSIAAAYVVRRVSVIYIHIIFAGAAAPKITFHLVSLNNAAIEGVKPQDLPASVIAVVGKSAVEDVILKKEKLVGTESSEAGPGTIANTFRVAREPSMGNANPVVDAVLRQIKQIMVGDSVHPTGNGEANRSICE